MKFIYKERSVSQLRNIYRSKVRKGVNGFISFEDFNKWYTTQKPECYYCGLKEIEMQEITINGLLVSKRFPQNGIISRGKNRAIWLEIDRMDPNNIYTRDNCVLSCYYCNNDKSDIFNSTTYVDFFQNRAGFLRKLLNNGK